MLFFPDHIKTKFFQHAVTVNKTEILDNFEFISVIDCLTDLQYVSEDCKYFPLVNAAGLTVLYTQKSFTSNVMILRTKLSGNYGSIAGAMLVIHYGTYKGRTVVYNSEFGDSNAITSIEKNSCAQYGASLALVMINVQQSSHALIVEKSTFKNQKSNLLQEQGAGAGAVFIAKFTQNSISTTGACLYAENYYFNENWYRALNIVMRNIIANENTQTEFFVKAQSQEYSQLLILLH